MTRQWQWKWCKHRVWSSVKPPTGRDRFEGSHAIQATVTVSHGSTASERSDKRKNESLIGSVRRDITFDNPWLGSYRHWRMNLDGWKESGLKSCVRLWCWLRASIDVHLSHQATFTRSENEYTVTRSVVIAPGHFSGVHNRTLIFLKAFEKIVWHVSLSPKLFRDIEARKKRKQFYERVNCWRWVDHKLWIKHFLNASIQVPSFFQEFSFSPEKRIWQKDQFFFN